MCAEIDGSAEFLAILRSGVEFGLTRTRLARDHRMAAPDRYEKGSA